MGVSIEVTIAGITFPISTPYAAGQTMTDAEAAALNQVRAENIGNNCRAAITKAKAEDGSITQDALDALTTLIAQKDAEYIFTLASVRAPKATLSPVEREAMVMAKAQLQLALSGANLTFKAYTDAKGKEYVDAKLAEIAVNDEIVSEAKRRVKERSKATTSIEL